MSFDEEYLAQVGCVICEMEGAEDAVNGYPVCSKECAAKADLKNPNKNFDDWMLEHHGIDMDQQMVPMRREDEEDYRTEWREEGYR
jgi:endogenous inhibitor of DNA gyrase (YacG/DUF329 family)